MLIEYGMVGMFRLQGEFNIALWGVSILNQDCRIASDEMNPVEFCSAIFAAISRNFLKQSNVTPSKTVSCNKYCSQTKLQGAKNYCKTELHCVTSVCNTVPFHTTMELERYVDVCLCITHVATV